jgi:uncharacterized protein YndB with AHSA1/START domain
MGNEVRTTTQIDVPPQTVWDTVMDPDRFGDWVTIHRGVKKVSDTPLVVGSTMEQRLCLRGVTFTVKWTVVELDEPHLVVMEGKGPARSKAITRDELTAKNGGTSFAYVNEFKTPMGPLGAAASKVLVGGISEREAKASLRKLKHLLEDS